MADVGYILGLMRHAADRLDAEKVPIHNAFAAQQRTGEPGMVGVSSAMASIALASTTLRLVASFLTETDDGEAQ